MDHELRARLLFFRAGVGGRRSVGFCLFTKTRPSRIIVVEDPTRSDDKENASKSTTVSKRVTILQQLLVSTTRSEEAKHRT